jgi:uncharacterized protein (DUF2252 family)
VGSIAQRLSVEEREARGRAARRETPRASHAELGVVADRDPIGLLQAQNATRVAELVPIRFGRMLASPFAFFRGAAVVMGYDLASLKSSGLRVQLAGDAHLLNFGGFASPDREVVFDLNDFDETLPGPFEWDLKRLAASLEIAGRERGFGQPERSASVRGAVRSYREAMRRFALLGDLDVWYARLDARSIRDVVQQIDRDRKLARAVQRSVARAQSNDGMRALSRLTHEVEGALRIVSEPPLIVPLAELGGEADESAVRAAFRSYRRSLASDRRSLLERFRYFDSARKVVGVGSVGMRCWMVLMLGRDERDPLLLQMKEAEASVLEPLLGPSAIASHGQRVVEGQRLMQAASDISSAGLGSSTTVPVGISTCASSETGRSRSTSRRCFQTDLSPMGSRAVGHSRARMHAPATESRLAHTSGRATRSIAPCQSSPPATQTSTSGTTKPSWAQLQQGRLLRSRASDPCFAARRSFRLSDNVRAFVQNT